MLTGSFHDPARAKLLETRKSVVNGWLGIADALDIQGEVVLARDVRHFARDLPRVSTDRELVAKWLLNHLGQRSHKRPCPKLRERGGRNSHGSPHDHFAKRGRE
jgi:hypothetical protein